MDITDRLFVSISPVESGHIPYPHPITDGHFDTSHIYKVLGMYNPSETSECYFVMTNPQREIWFIPQRHVRAFALLDCDELFLPLDVAERLRESGRAEVKAITTFTAPLDERRRSSLPR